MKRIKGTFAAVGLLGMCYVTLLMAQLAVTHAEDLSILVLCVAGLLAAIGGAVIFLAKVLRMFG